MRQCRTQPLSKIPPPKPSSGRAEAQAETKTKRQPPYHVVLWNDDDHTFDYVVQMMHELFGHPPEKGYQIAAKSIPRAGPSC